MMERRDTARIPYLINNNITEAQNEIDNEGHKVGIW